MRIISLFVLLTTTSLYTYGQQTSDSLVNLTYNELRELFTANIKDSLKSKQYATAYLSKSKKQNDSLNIATGYYLKSIISTRNNKRIRLYDSIIRFSKTLRNKNFPSIAYLDKGTILFNERQFKKALDNYILAKKYNNGGNKEFLNFLINRCIASLKNRTENNIEALDLYRKCWNYAVYKKLKESQPDNYFSLLASLSNSLRKNGLIDSSLIYNNKGLIEAKKLKLDDNYYHFVLNNGVINYHKKNYLTAYDSIKKGLNHSRKIMDKPNMAVAYYYLAKINEYERKTDKMLFHLKKMDTVFLNNNDILPYLRNGYEILISHYKNENNLKAQLTYINRLIKVDSILHTNEVYLNKNIIKEYDIPRLVNEKQIIIDQIKNNESKKARFILWLFLILIILSIILFYQYRKKQLYKKRFLSIIESNNSKITSRNKSSDSTINIPEDLIKNILEELEQLEKDDFYLNSDLTISILAKKLKTNSRYLSKIINRYKGQNFTNYINSLRIEYAINELKINPNFRKFTLLAIANEIGFKKAETFSKAFYKHKGLKPSYFLKNISNYS